ncbi:TerC family protein [Ammoniphilus sp. 3BR4]|uniref:TerC family protein n=1 Tax=Ammoniphilus sp. 3BR4 TaxID=3158265 RepID=UPI003467C47B
MQMYLDSAILFSFLSIIAIDLVLAGDNAVVIGMASKNLPVKQRRRAILWGTVGAVVVRILMTFVAVELLKVPLLMAIGGLLLVWVALKLLIEDNEHNNVESGKTFWQAVRTIIIADVIMGVDNIIAIAGASQGNLLLIIFGLAVSIPIIVWCSQFISKIMNKYPPVVYIGAAVIAYTAAVMIIRDPVVERYLSSHITWIIEFFAVAFVIVMGKWIRGRKFLHQ